MHAYSFSVLQPLQYMLMRIQHDLYQYIICAAGLVFQLKHIIVLVLAADIVLIWE